MQPVATAAAQPAEHQQSNATVNNQTPGKADRDQLPLKQTAAQRPEQHKEAGQSAEQQPENQAV